MSNTIQDTLAKMKAAIAGGNGNDFAKAYTVALGLVNYDLEAGAKLLFPWGAEITPLRNEIPRDKSNKGDTAHRWKQINGINTTNMPPGVSEGNRSGVIQTTESNRTSVYAGLGEEDYVTEEARYASEGFDDVLALASENLLKAVMISEERMILGGNSSVDLGTTPTPVAAAGGTTTGALADGTYYVGVVALTNDGYARATVAAGVVQQIYRTNADGSSDVINGGTAAPSAQSTGVTLSGGGTTQNLKAHVAAVRGAVAYAWYLGSSASHLYLQQITTINSVDFTSAIGSSTQDFVSLAATDYSNVGTYGFSGLLYNSAFDSTTSAYYLALATGTDGAGTQLTTDNSGGIKEFNTLLKDRWDNYRLTPDTIWVNSQEMISLKVLIVKNGGAPLIRMVGDINRPASDLIAGAVVGSYLDPVRGRLLKIRVHPFQSPGTILFTSKEAPYAGSRVAQLVKMLCRQEYYSTLWPMRTRKREYGVYVDETLLNYFPPAFGAITNVAATTS